MAWVGKVPNNSIPEFDGSPGKYRDYRFTTSWQFAAIKPENRKYYAPALVDALTFSAKELFRYRNPLDFQSDDGYSRFRDILDLHFHFLPETELVEACESFIYSLARGQRQGPTEFSAVFRTQLARLESVLSATLYQEQQIQFQREVTQQPEKMRQYYLDTARYDEAMETAGEDEVLQVDLGNPPTRPDLPEVPAQQVWHFPIGVHWCDLPEEMRHDSRTEGERGPQCWRQLGV